jgi:hypothetical protein
VSCWARLAELKTATAMTISHATNHLEVLLHDSTDPDLKKFFIELAPESIL